MIYNMVNWVMTPCSLIAVHPQNQRTCCFYTNDSGNHRTSSLQFNL